MVAIILAQLPPLPTNSAYQKKSEIVTHTHTHTHTHTRTRERERVQRGMEMENVAVEEESSLDSVLARWTPPRPGVCAMALAAVFFSGNAALAKLLSSSSGGTARYSPFQVLYWRGLITCIGTSVMLLYKKHLPIAHISGRCDLTLWAFGRGVLGTLAIGALYFGMSVLPLTESIVLFSLNPVFAMLASRVFLHEPITVIRFATIPVFLAGICVSVDPSSFTSGNSSPAAAATGSSAGMLWGSRVTILLGSMCSGLAIVFARKMNSVEVVHWSGQAWWQGFVAALLGPVAALFSPFRLLRSVEDLGFLFGMGMCALLAQLCVGFAIQREDATIVGILWNLDLVASLVWQVAVFGQVPRWFDCVGVSLVFLASVLSVAEKPIAQWIAAAREEPEEAFRADGDDAAPGPDQSHRDDTNNNDDDQRNGLLAAPDGRPYDGVVDGNEGTLLLPVDLVRVHAKPEDSPITATTTVTVPFDSEGPHLEDGLVRGTDARTGIPPHAPPPLRLPSHPQVSPRCDAATSTQPSPEPHEVHRQCHRQPQAAVHEASLPSITPISDGGTPYVPLSPLAVDTWGEGGGGCGSVAQRGAAALFRTESTVSSNAGGDRPVLVVGGAKAMAFRSLHPEPAFPNDDFGSLMRVESIVTSTSVVPAAAAEGPESCSMSLPSINATQPPFVVRHDALTAGAPLVPESPKPAPNPLVAAGSSPLQLKPKRAFRGGSLSTASAGLPFEG